MSRALLVSVLVGAMILLSSTGCRPPCRERRAGYAMASCCLFNTYEWHPERGCEIARCGCFCEGRDCRRYLYDTKEECEKAYSHCSISKPSIESSKESSDQP